MTRSTKGSPTHQDLLDLPPVLDVPSAGRLLGLGRTTSYELAQRDEFPVRVLRLGRQLRVPTADLLVVLGVVPNP